MSKTIRELIDAGILSLDTKVLGDPAMTEDGCMIGTGEDSRTWKWIDTQEAAMSYACSAGWEKGRYSSMEACEAAAASRKEGV